MKTITFIIGTKIIKILRNRARSLAQVGENLPSKVKAMSSNTYTKNQKHKTK
jgi:hypothetical protein